MAEYDKSARAYLAISIKHTEYKWKFGMPCILWGHRTEYDAKRSFGGYTIYPAKAEVYSLEDWEKSGYAKSDIVKIDEPVSLTIDFCKKYKKFDTVLVPYDLYLYYCIAAGLDIKAPKEEE